MKNKNLLFKLGVMTFVICGFFMSFVSAGIKFNLTGLQNIFALTEKEVTDNMMYVHFADNGNDFGGFLYFSNTGYSDEETEDRELYYVETAGDEGNVYECRTQVKGFYYNAERGDRLWPLDSETWSDVEGMNLTTSGGIFTSCAKSGYNDALNQCLTKCESTEGDCGTGYNECINNARAFYSADNYGYYGSLEQEYSGKKYNLVVGVKYNTGEDGDFISITGNSSLYPSFVRVGNKFPVGFIYDKNGGVGLAGCRFSGDSLDDTLDDTFMKTLVGRMNGSFNGLFGLFSISLGKLVYNSDGEDFVINCENISLADTLLKIVVEGLLGLDNGGSGSGVEDKLVSFGNSSDEKMQYFTTKTVSNSTMMNYARKRSESLCRGKWKTTDDPIDDSDKIVCFNESHSSTPIEAYTDALLGRTLIVKGGADVKIKPSTGIVYDIFVDGGNLLIEEDDTTEKYVINTDGYADVGGIVKYGVGNLYKIMLEAGDTPTNVVYGFPGIRECALLGGDSGCIYNGYDFRTSGDFNGNGELNITDGTLFINLANLKQNVASVIKGNFIVNGKIKSANTEKLENKYFVYGKLTSKDTFEDLEKEFLWRCNGGLSTNSVLHGSDLCLKKIGAGDNIANPYWNAFLVIIDQDYGSPLLKS